MGSPDFEDALRRLRDLPTCQVVGLHCHGSTHRGAADFAARTRLLLEACERYFPSPPEMVDIGGGLYSNMTLTLREQLGATVPTFQEYGEAVAGQVAAAYPGGEPRLVLEPGTALAANSTAFVTRVVDVKQLRGRRVALLAGSIHNVAPTGHGKRLNVRVHGRASAATPAGPVDLVGYTCMEGDCLAKGYDGPVAAGDLVVVSDVGAYTLVMKPPFILPAPPVVTFDARTGGYRLARRQEQLADVFATYRLG